MNSIKTKNAIKCITGSNAYMLYGELAPLLSGQYITIDMLPLSFKEYCTAIGKYYLVDTGMRNLLLMNTADDLGHLIENVVYLEPVRRGNKVSIGKLAGKKVDFVASSTEGITYYQVSATVLDEATLKRELDPGQITMESSK